VLLLLTTAATQAILAVKRLLPYTSYEILFSLTLTHALYRMLFSLQICCCQSDGLSVKCMRVKLVIHI
jgi:hypothetical protein